ncbi:MAG: translation initiation factor IF-3 [Spirochaetales bacterium]|jgi:translation initiation factor IF-3|nr:translation initiation factor IF-3 [Spirochaetales bacterium]
MATKERELRMNRQIRVPEVYVIDADNSQKGVMRTIDALQYAQDQGLDLIEVSPNANPPVCKILDYDKYRFQMEKRQKEARKSQVIVKVREVRMQPKIDVHDMDTKSKAIKSFLEGGDKCKVSVRFKGRELAHTELGKVVLDKILVKLDETGTALSVDQPPKMEGRMMSMLLSPSKVKK